jgi:hypothetical protein
MPAIHNGIIRFAAQKRSRLRLLAGAVYDTQRCRLAGVWLALPDVCGFFNQLREIGLFCFSVNSVEFRNPSL